MNVCNRHKTKDVNIQERKTDLWFLRKRQILKKLTEHNINEFGRLDELKKTVDKSKAKAYFEAKEQTKLNPTKVNIRTDKLLREFILSDGFDFE